MRESAASNADFSHTIVTFRLAHAQSFLELQGACPECRFGSLTLGGSSQEEHLQ